MPPKHNLNPSAVPNANALASTRIAYQDSVVRLFLIATIGWGIVSCVFGLIASLLLSNPLLFENLRLEIQPFVTFAKFNALQVNLTVFAFAANAVFTGMFYSTQRLCKIPIWSSTLALLHFFVWQVIVVLVAVSLVFIVLWR